MSLPIFVKLNNQTSSSVGIVGPKGEPGTTDYEDLSNKPQINNIPLTGSLTPNELGLAAEEEVTTITQSLNGILPPNATPDNQLATEAFVNSSIESMAARPLNYSPEGSPFPSKPINDQISGNPVTYYYQGNATTPSDNDYIVVSPDADYANGEVRYGRQGSIWVYRYKINDEPLTNAQRDTLNSGMTADLTNRVRNSLISSSNNLEVAVNPTTFHGTINGLSQAVAADSIRIDPIAAWEAWKSVDPINNTSSYEDFILSRMMLSNMSPDYLKTETINRITANNGTWTADRDGYVQLGGTYASISGMFVSPNYSGMESINRISTNNGQWVVDRDGYVYVHIYGSSRADKAVFINESRVGGFLSNTSNTNNDSYSGICTVSKGDIVRLSVLTGTFGGCNCFFIPPKYSNQDTAQVYINNKLVDSKPIFSNNSQSTFDFSIKQLSKNDIVRISTYATQASYYCYYIPPKYAAPITTIQQGWDALNTKVDSKANNLDVLTDAAASNTLPATTSTSLISKIQSLRNNIKYLLAPQSDWCIGTITSIAIPAAAAARCNLVRSSGPSDLINNNRFYAPRAGLYSLFINDIQTNAIGTGYIMLTLSSIDPSNFSSRIASQTTSSTTICGTSITKYLSAGEYIACFLYCTNARTGFSNTVRFEWGRIRN